MFYLMSINNGWHSFIPTKETLLYVNDGQREILQKYDLSSACEIKYVSKEYFEDKSIRSWRSVNNMDSHSLCHIIFLTNEKISKKDISKLKIISKTFDIFEDGKDLNKYMKTRPNETFFIT